MLAPTPGRKSQGTNPSPGDRADAAKPVEQGQLENEVANLMMFHSL